jgi:hypothetical protein
MPKLTKSEKKILVKIKNTMQYSMGNKYMFWFIYDDNKRAIDWEGGYGLALNPQFRNQYTLEKGQQVVQNW